MSNSNPEARTNKLRRDDPMVSVRALRIAMVHLTLRGPPGPPMKPMPDLSGPDELSQEAFLFEITRTISGWLGQPKRCPDKSCQRAKVCQGDPPDCWRAEPPPTDREIDLAKQIFHHHLSQLGAEYAYLE